MKNLHAKLQVCELAGSLSAISRYHADIELSTDIWPSYVRFEKNAM